MFRYQLSSRRLIYNSGKYLLIIYLLYILFYTYFENIHKNLKEELIDKRIVVSYVCNSRHSCQCRSNLKEFIQRAVLNHSNVTYIFSLVDDLANLDAVFQASFLNNVKFKSISIRSTRDTNLIIHKQIISDYLSTNTDTRVDVFILLSCEARGPYHRNLPTTSSLSWMRPYTSSLSNQLHALASTVSCQTSPHMHSYAMALDPTAAEVLLHLPLELNTSHSSQDLLLIHEVSLSRALLLAGLNFVSLDSRYSNRDFRYNVDGGLALNPATLKPLPPYASPRVSEHCDPFYYKTAGNSRRADPLLCLVDGDTGCRGVEPCETVFIKRGDDFISAETLSRASEEDIALQRRRPMCASHIGTPLAPIWDVKGLAEKLLLLPENSRLVLDDGANAIFIIRTHHLYADYLKSLLLLIMATDKQLFTRVIIIPTEKESYEILQVKLHGFFSQINRENFGVDILKISDEIFSSYSPYLGSICTTAWESLMKFKSIPDNVYKNRYCGVNSPVHYLIVDIALYLALTYMATGSIVVVTNADNSYSPLFFKFLIDASSSSFDIHLVNMVTKGRAINTSVTLGQVDLGAYAVNMHYLRQTCIGFLNSLPNRPQPQHYHDADFHFIQRLVKSGAKIRKSQDILFFHN